MGHLYEFFLLFASEKSICILLACCMPSVVNFEKSWCCGLQFRPSARDVSTQGAVDINDFHPVDVYFVCFIIHQVLVRFRFNSPITVIRLKTPGW